MNPINFFWYWSSGWSRLVYSRSIFVSFVRSYVRSSVRFLCTILNFMCIDLFGFYNICLARASLILHETECQRKRSREGCSSYYTSCQGQAIEVQNASATPRWPVRKNIKDTCRWRGLFYISLDLSTPIFSIWTLTLWKFFRNRLGLGQSTPIFFRPPTLKRICDVGRGLNVARSRTSLTHDRTYLVNAWFTSSTHVSLR